MPKGHQDGRSILTELLPKYIELSINEQFAFLLILSQIKKREVEAPERAGFEIASYPPTFSITVSQTCEVIGAESPQLEVKGLDVDCSFKIMFPGECKACPCS